MKRIILSAIVFVLLCTQAFAQDITGFYNGRAFPFQLNGVYPFSIDITENGQYISGMFYFRDRPDLPGYHCNVSKRQVGSLLRVGIFVSYSDDMGYRPIILDMFLTPDGYASGSYSQRMNEDMQQVTQYGTAKMHLLGR